MSKGYRVGGTAPPPPMHLRVKELAWVWGNMFLPFERETDWGRNKKKGERDQKKEKDKEIEKENKI